MKEPKRLTGEYGEMLYFDYNYRTQVFRQTEMTTGTQEAIFEMLTEIELGGILTGEKIMYGVAISNILKGKLAPRIMCTLLTHTDGTTPRQEEFAGLAREFNPFFKEVLTDFFSLNEGLLLPIIDFVREKLLIPLQSIAEMLPQLKSFLSLQAGRSEVIAKPEKSRGKKP